MNDKELMDKIYTGRCADELSAEELLERTSSAAHVRSRYAVAGAVAAAVVLGIGAGVIMKLSRPEKGTASVAAEPEAIVSDDDTSAEASVLEGGISSVTASAAGGAVSDGTKADSSSSANDTKEMSSKTESKAETEALSSAAEEVSSQQAGDGTVISEPESSSQEVSDKEQAPPEAVKLDSSEKEKIGQLVDEEQKRLNTDEETGLYVENPEEMWYLKVENYDLDKGFSYYTLDDKKDLLGTDDIFSLIDENKHYYQVPFSNKRMNGDIIINAESGVVYTIGASYSGLPDIARIEKLLERYPDHTKDTLFEYTPLGLYLYCFESGGRQYVIPYIAYNTFYNKKAVYEIPLGYTVYSFESIQEWASREIIHEYGASNALIYADRSTYRDRVTYLSAEDYEKVKDWFRAHETDVVHLPSDGMISDGTRFVPSDGTAFIYLYPKDGREVSIQRNYGSDGFDNGLTVIVRKPDGEVWLAWYADELWPDTKDIIAMMDSAR